MEENYKVIQDERNNIYVNQFQERERPLSHMFSENSTVDSIPADFVCDLQFFLDAISSNNLNSLQNAITKLSEDFMNLQPDKRTETILFENEIFQQIFILLTNPPSLEIYKLTTWLIVSIFRMSNKFKKFEIMNVFESYGLLNFLLQRFNPKYENYLNGEKDSIVPIDLDNFEIDLLPYYLHLFAFYCYRSNFKVRDIIIDIIIFPNRDFFFDDFDNNELILEASFLLCASTYFELNESQSDYINWLITLIIQNFSEFSLESEKFLIDSVSNLLEMEGFATYLFKFNFQEFLSHYINEITNNTTDDVMSICLLLQKELLTEDPSRVTIDYQKLIKIGCSKLFNESKLVAFKLFRKGLKLKKDSPFINDDFFQYFLKKLINGSFDTKSQCIKIIGVWVENTTKELVSNRVPDLIPHVTELLYETNVTDELNLIILNIIKKFFDNAYSSSENEFLCLKQEFENNDIINILEEIMKNSESPEINCQLSQNLLSIWSDQI